MSGMFSTLSEGLEASSTCVVAGVFLFLALVEVDELCFEELVAVGFVAAAYVKMRFAVTGFAALTDGAANVVFAAVVTS